MDTALSLKKESATAMAGRYSLAERWKWALVLPVFFFLFDVSTLVSESSPVMKNARIRQRILVTQHSSTSKQSSDQHYEANEEEKVVYGPYEEDGYSSSVAKVTQFDDELEEDTEEYRQNHENTDEQDDENDSSSEHEEQEANISEEDKDTESTMMIKKVPTFELSAEWARRLLVSGIMLSRPEQTEPDLFIPEHLDPGFMTPLVWRETEQLVCPYSRLTGVPGDLHQELLKFVDETGLGDLFESLVYEGANVLPPNSEKLFHLKEDDEYIVITTPEDEGNWQEECDLQWIDPATEKQHEKLLQVLTRSGFDLILESMAEQFESDSLAVTGVGFMLASHCAGAYAHADNEGAKQNFFNLVLPLIVPEDEIVSLDIGGFAGEELYMAELKLEHTRALLLSGETHHRTHDFDMRPKKGYRVNISIYIADIKDAHVARLVAGDNTAYFPPKGDFEWIVAQRGRHFGGEEGGSLEFDNGRKPLEVKDALGEATCQERAKQGLCNTDLAETRMECLKTCGVVMAPNEYAQYFPMTAAESEKESKLFPL